MPPIIAAVAGLLLLAPAGVFTTVAAATLAATGLVIGTAVLAGGILLSVLLKPKTASNASSISRLNETLDPDAFRKIVLGQTAAGNDEIYWEVSGTHSFQFFQVIAKASHRITAFVNLYIDGVLVTFTGHTGNYNGGVLQSYTTLNGVTATNPFGVTIGSGSYWTAASSMTGMAGRLMWWNYDQKKLPQGIPTRICDVVKGSPVYDPRKDSTQGGSGTHRANDNKTWTYTDLDSNSIEIGRNNALQMLRYLLGWKNNGYIVDGRGVDPADINYAAFITAANVCETQGYYTDCILSTGDTHSNNEAIIANGAQGVLLDSGGLWSYYPAYNDTASIAVAFTADDIISGIQWNPKASMIAAYNQIGGNFIDPSVTNLYVASPYPVIKDATYLSNDNAFPKRMTLDFQNVQDPTLAQKLARIALNKTRLTGTFQATFNYKALQAQTYDCITLTLPQLGFSARLFRVTSMSINPLGGIDMTLQEEDSSVYTGGTINSYSPNTGAPQYDRTQQVALGALTLSTVQLANITATAYDGIEVLWPAVANNVQNVEIEYQQNFLKDPSLLSSANWVPTGATIVTGQTDRFGGSTAFALRLTTSNTNDFVVQFIDNSANYSGITITFGGWLKAGTMTTNIIFNITDSANTVSLGNFTVTPTGTWTFFSGTIVVPASSPNGLRFVIDPTNDTTGTAGQTVLMDDMFVVLENRWSILPQFYNDRTGIVISNLLPATNYVVQARTISINNVSGAWSQEIILTNTYTTATQNQVFSQASDPSLTQTVTQGAIWNASSGTSYLRINNTWIALATAPSSISDGTVLWTDDTPGSNSFVIPSNALGHVWIELWGAGGGGIIVGSGKSYTYYGGSSGGYVKHFVAVTPGTTSIAYVLGAGGTAGNASANAGTGGNTTVTALSLAANGGHGPTAAAPSTAGAAGTASGGSLANTTGNVGQTPTTATGKGAPNGGSDVTSGVGSTPGGGGSGAAGASGRIKITSKT